MKKLWLVPTATVIECAAEDIICISVGASGDLDNFNGNTVDWKNLK